MKPVCRMKVVAMVMVMVCDGDEKVNDDMVV